MSTSPQANISTWSAAPAVLAAQFPALLATLMAVSLAHAESSTNAQSDLVKIDVEHQSVHNTTTALHLSSSTRAVLQTMRTADDGSEIVRIAETGDEPPGRAGAVFGLLRWPTLNASGEVVFRGEYANVSSGNEGVYRFRSGVLERVIDDGFNFSPPDQSGASSYTGFGPPLINDDGHVAFQAGFSFGDGNQGLYIVRAGQAERIFDNNPAAPVPGQPGATWSLFPMTAGFYGLLAESGHAATIARYRDAGFVEHEGVYVGTPETGVIVAADASTVPPGQAPGVRFTGFDPFMAMAGHGSVVFTASYAGGVGQAGIYRFNPDGPGLIRIADGSVALPGQPGASFDSFDQFPTANAASLVAFGASYVQGNGSLGIFTHDSAGTMGVVVDNSGAFSVPDHPGKSFTVFGPPVINAAGNVAFVAEFGSGPDDVGVFLNTDAGLVRVFDLADAVPGQPGAAFSQLGSIALNAAGEIAITARYTGGVGDEGIYRWDDAGLRRVIDESQDLFGRAPTNLDMMLGTGGSGGHDGKPRGMNDAGQIVFRATFANADTGVYLATPTGDCRPDSGPEAEIETLLIGDPGNPPDTNGLGSVPVEYRIGTFELTNAQYTRFLNAIAASDPNGVYDEVMTTSLRGGIVRNGIPGSYTYTTKPGFADKPASGFSWADAARYCNWLHNGAPTGSQGQATTEDGAYDLSRPLTDIVRKPGARWFLPTQNEWYKAAYYDPIDPGADAMGTPDYWNYPTRSDDPPVQAVGDASGDIINPGANVANYERGVDWNGTDCNDPNAPCGNISTVGSAGATSPWGAFDMGGNIYEWTEDLGLPIPGDPVLPTRIARGGDFANALVLLTRNLDINLNMQVNAANIGVRVARVVCEPSPCGPADLAAPFGTLDLGDVQTFITAFTTGDPAADLAEPMGQLDLADIFSFVAEFLAGCP